MDADTNLDATVSAIAAAIGEPARARMLYCLMDGHARTGTELAVVGGVSPSTASVHLHKLKQAGLIKVVLQGKHRFYSLEGPEVATVLEGLNVLAGAPRKKFVPTTPTRLRAARTCYDHIAGTVGVALHDRLHAMGWIFKAPKGDENVYVVSGEGEKVFESLGIDLEATRALRRRFACSCLDWSERRPHLGGALGAALLNLALKRKWVLPEPDCRALHVTGLGRREMGAHFGLQA